MEVGGMGGEGFGLVTVIVSLPVEGVNKREWLGFGGTNGNGGKGIGDGGWGLRFLSDVGWYLQCGGVWGSMGCA